MLDRYSLVQVMEPTPQFIGVLILTYINYSSKWDSNIQICNGQQEMRQRTHFLFAPSLKYSKREKSKKTKEKNLKFIANAILRCRHGHNVDWIVQQHSSGCAQMFCPEGGKMLKPHETSESSPPKASLSVQSPRYKVIEFFVAPSYSKQRFQFWCSYGFHYNQFEFF